VTTTITFTAFVPPKPAGRRFDIIKFLPQMNREEDVTGDLVKFIACLQEITDLLLFDIDRWTDILDPDKAPEIFLDAMLCDLGNPFDFDLTEIDKRRLISVLVEMYRQKGTTVGIINVIRFFIGVEVIVVPFNTTGWILGEGELGEDTILGPSAQFNLYAFNIVSPIALTAEQRKRIRSLVDLMKVAHEHFVDLIEPDTTVIDHVELGESGLGDLFLLH
jgi:phage tail-like protein